MIRVGARKTDYAQSMVSAEGSTQLNVSMTRNTRPADTIALIMHRPGVNTPSRSLLCRNAVVEVSTKNDV